MCTAMTLQSQSNEIFFGRTMDFSHDIIPQLYIVPSSYVWYNPLNNTQIESSYRFIGLGQELDGILGFFDGVNEEGFAAAALYFAGHAQYDTEPPKGTEPIASVNFLQYLLSKCASVRELPSLLKEVSVVGMEDPVTHTVAPLHWIATDKSGTCVVMEPTFRGLELINNPVGVMANSPDFNWHMTNLRNYTEASPAQTEEVFWGPIRLIPFGQAAGTSSLPGGFTSPARFVRTSYLKTHLPEPKDSQEAIAAGFHILENVSIPKGAVVSSRDTHDYTKYTAFLNVNTGEYFYKTYDDIDIRTASLWQQNSGTMTR